MATTATNVVTFPRPRLSLVDAFIRGLATGATRVVYRRAIGLFEEFLSDKGVLQASRRDVEDWRFAMESRAKPLSPSTIAKRMSALTGFYRFAIGEQRIETNPAAAARRPKLPTESPRQGVSPVEVSAILAVCDVDTIGLRDRAMVTVLALQAWRISSLLGLNVEDLGVDGGHRVATIRAKGSKVVRVALASESWSVIQKWVEEAGITKGPIFIPVRQGGALQFGSAMSSQSANRRIKVLARRAGIERDLHPHLFRHGAITQALDASVPLRDVQDFALHADPKTTRRYDSHRRSLNNPTTHVLASKMLGRD
jgi:integrase/recombinase XerD